MTIKGEWFSCFPDAKPTEGFNKWNSLVVNATWGDYCIKENRIYNEVPGRETLGLNRRLLKWYRIIMRCLGEGRNNGRSGKNRKDWGGLEKRSKKEHFHVSRLLANMYVWLMGATYPIFLLNSVFNYLPCDRVLCSLSVHVIGSWTPSQSSWWVKGAVWEMCTRGPLKGVSLSTTLPPVCPCADPGSEQAEAGPGHLTLPICRIKDLMPKKKPPKKPIVEISRDSQRLREALNWAHAHHGKVTYNLYTTSQCYWENYCYPVCCFTIWGS